MRGLKAFLGVVLLQARVRSAQSEQRSYDGTGNNVDQPLWGSVKISQVQRYARDFWTFFLVSEGAPQDAVPGTGSICDVVKSMECHGIASASAAGCRVVRQCLVWLPSS